MSERPGTPLPATGADSGGDAAVLARFDVGPGNARTEVRLPDRARPAGALRADAADRARFGAALADNSALRMSPDAAEVLKAGGVDARLMTVLAALTAAHRITVREFVAVDVEPAQAPRRTALITAFDGAPTTDPATARIVEAWLARQLRPYTPALTHRPGDPLRVSYPAPSPLGLLSG